jgi:secreted PhoX family phosphatase
MPRTVGPPEVDRRRFLRLGVAAAGAIVAGPVLPRAGGQVESTPASGGPYGPLQAPDALGLRLPAGFRARLIGLTGEVVAGTGYRWHPRPDGGATFPAADGGWIYVSNSEVRDGSVGAVRFDPSGAIADAYSILRGSTINCAGGATPWGTWLSCEEVDHGRVWECDPTGARPAVVRSALGAFKHEAACVDPVHQHVYLTEDEGDGRLYRFTSSAWPSLERGTLEVAVAAPEGTVAWRPVPDPDGTPERTRTQVDESTPFRRGEGIWFDAGVVYFVTTGDGRVWAYDTDTGRLDVLYDPTRFRDPPLVAPDNITVAPDGIALAAEDVDRDQGLVLVGADGSASALLRLSDQPGTEITGPAFDPSGTRLYFSSQRGPDGRGEGATYEVTGPFRRRPDPPSATTSTVTRETTARRGAGAAAPNRTRAGDGDGGGLSGVLAAGGTGAAVLAALAAGWRLRTRRPPRSASGG